MARRVFSKDPDGVKPFWFDFTRWLRTGEAIATADVTAAVGITKDSSNVIDSGTRVIVVLSGGTVGARYPIQCRVTTDSSPARVTDKTMYVDIIEG